MGKLFERCSVLENEAVAQDVYSITLTSPMVAAALEPGQFVHLHLNNNDSEILRLPFSVYDVVPELGAIVILYQVLGNGTRHMTRLQMGDICDVIGPIGRGWFPPKNCSRALLVGGGLGTAPLYLLAKQLKDQGAIVDVVMGAGCSSRVICRDTMAAFDSLHIATDDGSEGFKGFCTSLSKDLLALNDYDYVATCGPEPMQRIVAAQCKDAGVPCQVSMERLMACGVGACLSCVLKTTAGLKRCCVDGPVFDAMEVIWDAK
ncbi:MAG: dihydroorotate dehydrogenase electron transfer subunit [Coriobacteriales bacterium]|nr:dihydroorotate dehydrogenase electron transfer subunit [Coriobacteriales bacterium]